ncbi:hypothetical protein SAMN02990966_06861 [Rhodospirillales bacterium URHD0017]|nr:hypothetical protein SAMN02990966_06861 [Rhodospirillales bacterium URHD0017]
MARTGRPKFKPTKLQRDLVRRLRADRWSQERIARVLHIDVSTLILRFGADLERVDDELRADLLRSMWSAARHGSVSAARWWLKRTARARAAAANRLLAYGSE